MVPAAAEERRSAAHSSTPTPFDCFAATELQLPIPNLISGWSMTSQHEFPQAGLLKSGPIPRRPSARQQVAQQVPCSGHPQGFASENPQDKHVCQIKPTVPEDAWRKRTAPFVQVGPIKAAPLHAYSSCVDPSRLPGLPYQNLFS